MDQSANKRRRVAERESSYAFVFDFRLLNMLHAQEQTCKEATTVAEMDYKGVCAKAGVVVMSTVRTERNSCWATHVYSLVNTKARP
jgi:hypothetical protein